MNENLTDRQIAFIVLGAMLGQDFVIIPKAVAEKAGTGGWITILFSTIVFALLIYMFAYVGYIHKNKTLYEYSQLLVGKYVTYIFSLLYFIYFLAYFSINARRLCESMNILAMPETPVIALYILLLFIIFIGVSKKLKVLARLNEIYITIIMVMSIAIISIVFSQGNIINIMPFIETSEIKTYITASHVMITPLIGFEILGCCAMNKNNTKKALIYPVLMVLFLGMVFIYLFEASLSVIGIDDIVHYRLTLFNTLRSIDVPYLDFLKRLDGLAMVLWCMSTFCHLSLFAYGAVFYVKKCVKKVPYNLLVITLLALSFFIYQAPKTYNQTEDILTNLSYISLFTGFLIPVTLLILTKVKKYDKSIK